MYHFPTVAADRASAEVVAQLAELRHDAHAAPAGVLPGQASGEFLHLSGHTRSSRSPTMPAPPAPVLPPGRVLPANHRFRSY